jgi:ankyrin repeat protein
VVGPLTLRESVRGRTALHSTSDWRCTRALAAGGADLEAVADGDGHTPLQTAAVEGKAEVVAQLLEAGAKVNARATTVGGCRTC